MFDRVFSYGIVKERKVYVLENNSSIGSGSADNIGELIQNSLKQTSSALKFSFGPCENDPNLLQRSGKANCIGYSALLAALLQAALNKHKLDKEWKVKHEVGEIYFLNKNINQYFTSKFFKDHDFVVLENTETKERIAMDASLYDYFRINKIRLK